MDVNIYIASHKKFEQFPLKDYRVLQVGAEGKESLGYLRDNTGDNISYKNPNYCELTGLYWIWKNDKKSDVTGLVHYRRYFSTAKFSSSSAYFLDGTEIGEILRNYDIILPKREWLKETAWEEYYMVSGLEKDLKRVEKIIGEVYPECMPAFCEYFYQNRSWLYNMMICRKELFDEYCEWLFDILFRLETQVDYKDYSDYQKRIFGFMSERLLNVWVIYKNLKVKELRTVNTEMSLKERLRIWLRRRKNRMVFAARHEDRVKRSKV